MTTLSHSELAYVVILYYNHYSYSHLIQNWPVLWFCTITMTMTSHSELACVVVCTITMTTTS